MNDLKILHDAWSAPAAPSPGARADARAALLARAGGTRPRTARRLPLAAAAACALAVAIALAVAANVGSPGLERAVPLASAEVLERAAAAAERRPFTPPRDDQWIYLEDRITSSAGGETTSRKWHRADGGGMAWIDETGKLRVETLRHAEKHGGRPAPALLGSYHALAALPTDPDALLRWAYEQAEHITGGGVTEHGDVYLLFNHMLRENVVPPKLEAAIFRAMKRIPSVTVETVDVLGRPAYALGITQDWLHEELLLDKESYAYLGERSTVVRDATIDPLKAGNATGEVKQGSKVVAARIAIAIVDEPGRRR